MTVERNNILLTKDGRNVGNSIVIYVFPNEEKAKVKTDYGNELELSFSEIDGLFYKQTYYDENHKKHTEQGHKYYTK